MYNDYFKNKKVTIMGLGLLGGALNDALFLLKQGAKLTITDLKTEEELKPSIKQLAKYSDQIKYVLGKHDLEDFKNVDLILQPGNVPINSPYLAEARKNNIPIYESESLFMKLADGITTIGITGTRGKTTTTNLIYEILKKKFGKKVYLAGNVKGISTLSLLNKIRRGDIVVMELDSWCLNGFGDIKKSPNISVFTNFMPDHLNFYLKGSKDEKEAMDKYFNDKSQIYLNQKSEDFIFCGKEVSKKIGNTTGKKIIVKENIVPKNWKIKILGEHNIKNISFAIAVGRIMNVSESVIKKVVEGFSGVSGRLQLVKQFRGVKIYNDTTSTTPDAVLAGLRTLNNKKNIVLIMGGSDKNLDMTKLVKEIPNYCKEVLLLSGTGTEKMITGGVSFRYEKFDDLKSAVKNSIKLAKKGDVILFSPGFASFGMFKNEFDRGEKFLKELKRLG